MNLKNQLRNIDIRKIRFDNGETLEHFVKRAADALYADIRYEFDLFYFAGRKPQVYQRDRHSVPWKDAKNYSFRKAMFVEDYVDVSIDNSSLAIKIKFNANAYHESVVRSNGRYGNDGYLPILLNYGWSWSGWEGKNDFFHDFEGLHFIEKGIERFQKRLEFKRAGISIHISSVLIDDKGRDYLYNS